MYVQKCAERNAETAWSMSIPLSFHAAMSMSVRAVTRQRTHPKSFAGRRSRESFQHANMNMKWSASRTRPNSAAEVLVGPFFLVVTHVGANATNVREHHLVAGGGRTRWRSLLGRSMENAQSHVAVSTFVVILVLHLAMKDLLARLALKSVPLPVHISYVI